MKKVILSTFMAMFLFVGLTSMLSADPPSNAVNCQTDCSFLVNAGIFNSQGDCMSACNTCLSPSGGTYSGPGTATGNIQVNHIVCECKILKNANVPGNPSWAELGISNMGDCIALLQQFHGL